MITKKASTTFTELFIGVIVVMALFYGLFGWVSSNYGSAGVTSGIGFSKSLLDIETSQANLTKNIQNIKLAVPDITEANPLIALISWNGLTGLAAVLRLPITLIDVALNVFNAIFPGLGILPEWVKVLIEAAILVVILFTIIGAFKGEEKS